MVIAFNYVIPKFMKHLFIIVFILLCMSSCELIYDSKLTLADKIMQEKPDSALSVLNKINGKNIWLSCDKALYSLLLTEALYKTGVDETNDSLISIAVNYYKLKEQDPLRARAYYQKGMIQANGNNYSDALLSFMLAEETASLTENIKQLALIHRAMGDTFERMRNSRTSVSYYQKSYDEFKSINDTTYTTWALYDLARAYYNSAQYEDCVKIAKDCLHSAEKRDDDNLKACALSLLGGAYELNNNNEDAIYYLRRLHKEYPSDMSVKDWNSLGIAYLYSGNLHKAKECEDSIKKKTSEQSWLSYLTAYHVKDYKTALELLRSEYRDACNTSIENMSRTSEKKSARQIWFNQESSE